MRRLPDFPLEGGCLCGAVRYAISGPPLAVYTCHCKDCQRTSGAAFSMSMPTRAPLFVHLKGEVRRIEKVADSGRTMQQVLCATCGTRCWNEPASSPDMIVVKPGTLDDLDWAIPIGNIWTASRAAFVEIDPGLVNFEGQPESREPLYAAWDRWLEGAQRNGG